MKTPAFSRFIAFATGTLLLAAIIPLASVAQSFSDVSASTQYKAAIEALQSKGVIEGYSDGTFKAINPINRAEFLKIILEARADGELSGSDCFPDVNDEWFAKYVCTAKAEGIVGGYPDGTFKPDQQINFVEASKILALAYEQQIQTNSQDWYEGYVRAIESSKGIPPSVDTLDEKITRGEMAEMMWRLSEGITDQPTKGYMNVKYPQMQINLAADTPQTAKSCVDLRAFTEEASRSGFSGDGDMMFQERVGAPVPASSPQKGVSDSAESGSNGPSYSDTNVQVEGVDEGDIVKTDGNYLYIVNSQKIRIVSVGSSMNVSSTLDHSKDGFTPTDLYVVGNRLVVLGSTYPGGDFRIMEEKRMMTESMIYPPYPYYPPKAEVRVYDVTDRTNPKQERKVSFEGSTVSSRRIDGKLYLVINNPVRWNYPVPLRDVPDADLLPKMEDSKTGVERMVAPCNDVIILPHIPSPQYLTVAVVPLESTSADVKSEVILGSAENIYASLDNLYVATTEYKYLWDAQSENGPHQKTNLYRFAFESDGVSLGAQGSVPGRILNQFSMDEHESHFRIATTIDQQWRPDSTTTASSNNLYVLNQSLNVVGKIEGIAPGETIYSTRFLGDRTYMVTFQKIDPLFVIDTSDPRNPTILGKLKIPGYSDYLHPYDEDHIIGFGKEAVEAKEGDFAWYQGMKIAIFDVSDVENPQELHKVVIGDRGTESPLLHNHKALLFEKDRDLLSFPLTVAKITNKDTANGMDPSSAYGSPVFQGAYVYDISLDDGFKLRGSITHYTADEFEKAGDYWYPYGKDVERIVRVGESLYTISQAGVKKNAVSNLVEQGKVTFDTE